MCTVTFIPLENAVIFTSNRDEHISRGDAAYPAVYDGNQVQNIYPKDPKAGGTWFISNAKGDVGVLLNGAFTKHLSSPPYRKSRGQMLLDLFDTHFPYERMCSYDFSGIENFTLVLWQDGCLREIRWDGLRLKQKIQSHDRPHIWSSVTLYTGQMIQERHEWFQNWLSARKKITPGDIFHFHFHTQNQNKSYGLRIDRGNQISTTSITCLHLKEKQASFRHYDLLAGKECILEYDLCQLQEHRIVSKNIYELDPQG